MTIKENLTRIKAEIGPATLVAVSKTHPVEKIREAFEAGQIIFGENKVQELLGKYEVLPKEIQWHLIGHLQSNKVKYIAPFISLIHSIDSLKLLQEVDKQARKCGRVIPCLLQVHIAREETKFGLDENELNSLLQNPLLIQMDHIIIVGLMGMATLTSHEQEIRKEFKGLRKLFENLKLMDLPQNVKLETLSMGMSSDYIIALQEGSTMVRVGSALFGSRS